MRQFITALCFILSKAFKMLLGKLYSVDFKNRVEPAVSSGCPVPVFLNLYFELTPVLVAENLITNEV